MNVQKPLSCPDSNRLISELFSSLLISLHKNSTQLYSQLSTELLAAYQQQLTNIQRLEDKLTEFVAKAKDRSVETCTLLLEEWKRKSLSDSWRDAVRRAINAAFLSICDFESELDAWEKCPPRGVTFELDEKQDPEASIRLHRKSKTVYHEPLCVSSWQCRNCMNSNFSTASACSRCGFAP